VSIIQAPISMQSNSRIKRFINKTLIPQMMLWGLKDGMSEKEIDAEIDKELGKTIKEKIELVRSGKFDEWDIEDLI
jgi:hypothetical protein